MKNDMSHCQNQNQQRCQNQEQQHQENQAQQRCKNQDQQHQEGRHQQQCQDQDRENKRPQVAITHNLMGEYIDLMREVEPRADYIYEPTLARPQRYTCDYEGDPQWERGDEGEKQLRQLLLTADVILGVPDGDPRKLADIVRTSDNLRWVHTLYAGGGAQIRAAKLNSDQLSRIQWTMSAGVHAMPLAEWALLGILAGIKNLPRLMRDKNNHEWPAKRWLVTTLDQVDAVIVGMGEVGQACARVLSKNGVSVRAVNRSIKDVDCVNSMVTTDQIVKGVTGADVLINALPGTPSTSGMISDEVMAALKPGATIVSIGRGQAVDENAMIAHLQSGQLGFAALDVFEKEPLDSNSPLWDLDNVMIAPHSACLTENEPELIVRLFLDNLTRFIDGKPLQKTINTTEWY